MGLTAGIDLAGLAVDGRVPRRYVEARSADDVVAAIRAANEARDAIVLWGGGTRIHIGDPPERYDVALDLRGLQGVVDHEPADLTVTVRAGTTLAELAEALTPHGQRWPVEVAHPERATVGGTVASAADGPSRYAYFHPRDWTIGCRAVLGDATLTRAGGRVVKNVTGYDLTRLYSGSYGTLCALVELSLKLTAIPERTVTLRADLPDPQHAYRATRELLRARLPLDGIAVVMGPDASVLGCPTWTALFVRLAGTAAAVERLAAALADRLPFIATAGEEWTRIAALPADAGTSVRAAWPPGEPVELYPERAVWYPGIDLIHVLDEQTPEELRGLRAEIEERSGAVVIERGPLDLKRAVGAWGTPRLPGGISQRLRSLFDPRGVLAPGRMP